MNEVKDKKIVIIGGDLRSIALYKKLKEKNSVCLIGFDNYNDENIENIIFEKNILKGFEYIILPIPTSTDDITINTTFSQKKIKLHELFENTPKNAVIIGAKLSLNVIRLAESYDLKIIDYLQREEFAVLNALPTAEGAIMIALEMLKITLCNSRTLVLGFGRIGKILSHKLKQLGAQVTVVARKPYDIAWIKIYGYLPLDTEELENHNMNFNVIFNTIPNLILDNKILSKLEKDCLIVDLASDPGGVDFEVAKKLGLNVVWALSLPGKVAPITAGEIIKDTIENIIIELEEA